MALTTPRGEQREAARAQADRAELVERIARALPEDGTAEVMKGLHFSRWSRPTEPCHGVAVPAFCVIAQGSKEVLLGEERYLYDPYHYLISSVGLPVVSHIAAASVKEPCLALRLNLDPALVGSVMVESGGPPPRVSADVRAMHVSLLDANLLDAVVRLVRPLDSPAEAAVLAPLVTREIVYRLLAGEQGARLRHVAVLGGHSHRVAQAVERLRRDYDRPLRIEGLAREFGMSVSGFHHHFKTVTGMSPLQFQKQVRLQEARRLLLGEDLDAATAGYRVGYEDASHFSREYKRLFGQPPMRDVEQLREAVKASAVL